MTKIHYFSAITVPQLSFHTDLSELLSCQASLLRTVGSLRRKKYFEGVSMVQKDGNLKAKILPPEREHSGSSVIKGDAALNTRH